MDTNLLVWIILSPLIGSIVLAKKRTKRVKPKGEAS